MRCDSFCGTFKQRRSRLLAPRLGGGVRLRGVVRLLRSPLHPVCRFAQDDTWETGAWDEKQSAVSVRKGKSCIGLESQNAKSARKTNCRIIPVDCTIFCTEHIWYHAPVTHRVILSEAAPPAKNQARPPVIAAQSNPAPQAGRQQAGSPLFQRDHVTHTAPRLPMGKGNCTQ